MGTYENVNKELDKIEKWIDDGMKNRSLIIQVYRLLKIKHKIATAKDLTNEQIDQLEKRILDILNKIMK
jgi:GTP-binding protein EngB required for normal cell division